MTSRVGRLRRRLERGDGAAVALCALFVAWALPLLPALHHNFDEGVYIQQALLIRDGLLPYRDFFCHQTPLHLFVLAAAGWPAPDSLLLYRLPSLLASAAAGFLVYRIALAWMSRPAALAACALALVATVQFHGLLALPNALMAAFATAAVWLAWVRRGPRAVALGGVLLAVSVLFKPLSITAGAALGLALLLDRERRHDLPRFALAAAVTGLAAGALFDALSGGAFHELLALQLSRYADKGGFEVMQALPTFRDMTREMGIESALGWNWDQHVRAFWLGGARASTALLAGLALAGALAIAFAGGKRMRGTAALLVLWWALPAAACLLLWEPIWDHYLIQYAAPMALLAGFALERAGARAWTRVLAVLCVAAIVFAGASQLALRRKLLPLPDYGAAASVPWLTFDPFVNFRYGSPPACGLIDPFNVYGASSLIALAPGGAPARFHVSTDELIACLEDDPRIRIGIGYWGTFFVDERLRTYLGQLPPERFLPGSRYAPGTGSEGAAASRAAPS